PRVARRREALPRAHLGDCGRPHRSSGPCFLCFRFRGPRRAPRGRAESTTATGLAPRPVARIDLGGPSGFERLAMTALSKRPSRWPFGLAAGVIAASVALAIFLLGRAFPPRRITMATGPEGGAYHELGKRYQAALAREHIHLALETTPGDLTNL